MIENSSVSEHSQSALGPSANSPNPRTYQSQLGKLAILVFAAATAFVLLEAFYVLSRRRSPAKSILIVPFSSADTSNSYLSDGISEDLARTLSQIRGLSVISLDASSYGPRRESDPQELARDAHVRMLLYGEVRRQGSDIAIRVRLIDARTGAKVWDGRYAGQTSELQRFQEEMARALCLQFRLKLDLQEQHRLAWRSTADVEAYQLYLQGRYFCKTAPDSSRGIDFLERAITRDPADALAYAALSACYSEISREELSEPAAIFPKAKSAAMKALQLDPQLAEAHTSLAIADAGSDFEWPAAEREFQRALALDPNDAVAHQSYGFLLAGQGDLEGAMREMSRAQELDPLSARTSAAVAAVWYWSRDYQEAIGEYQKTLELDPNLDDAREGLALVYGMRKEYPQGIDELQDAGDSQSPARVATLAWLYAASGHSEQAKKLLADLVALSASRYVSPVRIASIESALADQNQAFTWLDKAYVERDSRLALIKVLPEFDSLRSDPRFGNLLRRLRLTPAGTRPGR